MSWKLGGGLFLRNTKLCAIKYVRAQDAASSPPAALVEWQVLSNDRVVRVRSYASRGVMFVPRYDKGITLEILLHHRDRLITLKTKSAASGILAQVMSLVMSPFLLDDPRVYEMFPRDAIERARNYLVHIKGGIGAYSDSKGNPYIRQEVGAMWSLFSRRRCHQLPRVPGCS